MPGLPARPTARNKEHRGHQAKESHDKPPGATSQATSRLSCQPYSWSLWPQAKTKVPNPPAADDGVCLHRDGDRISCEVWPPEDAPSASGLTPGPRRSPGATALRGPPARRRIRRDPQLGTLLIGTSGPTLRSIEGQSSPGTPRMSRGDRTPRFHRWTALALDGWKVICLNMCVVSSALRGDEKLG